MSPLDELPVFPELLFFVETRGQYSESFLFRGLPEGPPLYLVSAVPRVLKGSELCFCSITPYGVGCF